MELRGVGSAAEEIYGLVKGGRWKHADGKLEALKKGEQPLKGIQNEESSLLLPRLVKTTTDLEEALGARNRMDSLRFANRLTFIEAVMAGSLESPMLTNMNLLDYFGRELEIWSEAKNLDRLSNLVVRMHLTWQSLMPQLITDGCGTKHVKKFSEIMKNLELAKTPEEYGRLAGRVSEEIDSLDKACRNDLSRSRPGGGMKQSLTAPLADSSKPKAAKEKP